MHKGVCHEKFSSSRKEPGWAAVEEELPRSPTVLQTTTNAVKRLATESVDAVPQTAHDFLDQGKAKVHEIGDNVEPRPQ